MKSYSWFFIVIMLHAFSLDAYAMLRISELRMLYPEYDNLGDCELAIRYHDTKYPEIPLEQFMQQFGGALLKKNAYFLKFNEVNIFFDKYINLKFDYSVAFPSESIVYDRVDYKKQGEPHKNKIKIDLYRITMFVYVERPTTKDIEIYRFFKNGHFDTRAIKEKIIQDDDKYISPIVNERYVSNNVAYSVASCYKYIHAGKSLYSMMYSMTTYANNKVYSVIVVTDPLNSVAESQEEGERLSSIIKAILDSFMINAN